MNGAIRPANNIYHEAFPVNCHSYFDFLFTRFTITIYETDEKTGIITIFISL
jgi:hypothetical protein